MAHNVEHRIVGDKLVIEIGLAPHLVIDAPLAKSEKCSLIGSSGGFVPLEGISIEGLEGYKYDFSAVVSMRAPKKK